MVTVGFSTTKGNLFSWLIRKFSSSKFSHVWVRYYHPLYKLDIVVEAGTKGIIEIPYKVYIRKITSIVELQPPADLDAEEALEALGPSIALPYDYGSVIGRLWVKISKFFGQKIKNPFRNRKRDACIDNAYRYVQALGLFPGIDPEEETPQSLYDRLVKSGWRSI